MLGQKQISENFSLNELIDTSKPFDNTPTIDVVVNLCRLVFFLLQPLRNFVKCGISVMCAYRSPKVNAACGGTETSQHLKGMAADINCETIQKFDLFKIIALNFDFDQLIFEVDSNCLHVSYVSTKENRHQILIRKIVSGEKKYYPFTKETLKSLTGLNF